MNYTYKISQKNNEVSETCENNISIKWSISDLNKESPGIVSVWLNRQISSKERKDSFQRTKKWVLENHPEILI
jgi:hypothetical protein